MSNIASFQGNTVRLLYSDKSRILSVHLVNLNPYPQAVERSPTRYVGQLQPVYLQRGLERMRLLRSLSDSEFHNGLQMWQIPNTKKLVFREGTEDWCVFRRRNGMQGGD